MSIVGSPASPEQIFKWWEWTLSIPDRPGSTHPGKGGDIDQMQPDPFFCHVCTFGSGTDLTRRYTVKPKDFIKPILVPVLTAEASTAENSGFNDAQLLNKARQDLQNPQNLILKVDNQDILTQQNAQQYYVESAAGHVTPERDNILRLPNSQMRMRCLGFFVLLSNFGHGRHIIKFGGSAGPSGNRIETLVQYEVNFP